MKKIGLFLDEIKDKNIDENQKFSKLGFNTGNMLFWHSLKVQLDLDVKSRWYIDHIDQLDLTQYKAFVTTDLIWIRQMQDFSYLNKTLDVIGDLPLIPISIGLQCDSCLDDFKLHPETVKVLKRISERCVMGVRGNYTASILRKYGIDNFKVIGCPSMYMNAPGLLTVGNNSQPHKVSMNFETFYSKLDEKRINFLEYGAKNQFDFVEQAQAELTKEHIQDKNRLLHIQDWMKNKQKSFFNIDEWRSYMREHDFSFGSRFHGNVLALWEGVPALFITCDSRTQELCEHFSLPCIDVKDFDKSKPVEYYYGLADYTKFHQNYSKRVEEWKEFLGMNGLVSKRKILYHAANAGCFVKCLIHKCIYHPHDDAIFVGYSWLEQRFGIPDKYIKHLEYDPIVARPNSEMPEDALKKVIVYFDNLFKENQINIHELDNIYIGSYYGDFSLYVNYIGVKHSIFEEAIGDWKRLQWDGYDTFNTLIDRFEMAEYNNNLVCHRYGVMKYWYKDNKSEKDVNFEPYNEIRKMSEVDKKFFVDFFKLPEKLSFDNEYNVLLLTQWYKRNGVKWNDDGIIEMYKILLDYTVPDSKKVRVFIKPHPADPKRDDYDKIRDSTIISSDCISELIGLIPNIHFHLALTISSSSIFTVEGYSDKTFSIGYNFIYQYHNLNKLSLLVNDFFKMIDCEQIYRYGIMDSTVDLFKNISLPIKNIKWGSLEDSGNSFVICDLLKWSDSSPKINVLNISVDTVCAFINIEELIKHFRYDLAYVFNNSVVYKIIKTDLSINLEEEEYIVCFSKNNNKRNVLKKIKGCRRFRYQNSILEYCALDDKEKRIFSLEMMAKNSFYVEESK